jgi:hypothetical protein
MCTHTLTRHSLNKDFAWSSLRTKLLEVNLSSSGARRGDLNLKAASHQKNLGAPLRFLNPCTFVVGAKRSDRNLTRERVMARAPEAGRRRSTARHLCCRLMVGQMSVASGRSVSSLVAVHFKVGAIGHGACTVRMTLVSRQVRPMVLAACTWLVGHNLQLPSPLTRSRSLQADPGMAV